MGSSRPDATGPRLTDKAKWRLKYPKRELLSHARQRSKRYGYAFSITESDFEIPSRCPILGIDIYVAHGSKGPRNHSPTLDRIDNEKGYVPGNVWVISALANRIKGARPLKTVLNLLNTFEV